MESPKHTMKTFDVELDLLKSKVKEMGGICSEQLDKALKALDSRDGGLVEEIIRGDERVDTLQDEVDELTVRLLALRQPMAQDLRNIVSALKMAAEFERVADYSVNIAKYVPTLNSIPLQEPIGTIRRMAEIALHMLEDVVRAYERLDVDTTVTVWHRDDEIDDIYEALLDDLRKMMSDDGAMIKAGTSLLFVARCCERIGDHIANVADNVHYIISGVSYRAKSRGKS
jgi:phosphate transport system protein